VGSASQHCTHAHSSLVSGFLENLGIPVVQQPCYSPDIAPYDFWLFPKLKMALKGKRFDNIGTIKENMMKHLSSVPKDPFKKCFQQRQNCWHKCIASEGAYFEGD
jgi:hypothetical protein